MSNKFIKEEGDTKKPTSDLSNHDEKSNNSSSSDKGKPTLQGEKPRDTLPQKDTKGLVYPENKPNKESFPDEKPDHSRYPGQKETETKTQARELKSVDDKIANNQKSVSKPDNEK